MVRANSMANPCVISSSFMLFTRSATIPPKIELIISGIPAAMVTIPRLAAEPVILKISHPLIMVSICEAA